MLFLLILPVLVAGFFACHIHPVHSYRLHRYEGQYLYLRSAALGLKCFAIAFLLALSGHYLIPNSLSFCSFNINLELSSFLDSVMKLFGAATTEEAKKMAWFFLFSALLFVAAFLVKSWAHVRLRFRFGRWNCKVFVIGELLDDSPLDSLLFQASLKKEKSIMLSMSDRKVYVGKVISLGEPSETSGMDQDVSILPIMSGYRNKDDLNVDFTTRYEDAETDIYISLRQDAIISATEFDFPSYQKWKSKKELKDKEEAASAAGVVMANDEGGWWLMACQQAKK